MIIIKTCTQNRGDSKFVIPKNGFKKEHPNSAVYRVIILYQYNKRELWNRLYMGRNINGTIFKVTLNLWYVDTKPNLQKLLRSEYKI